MQEKILRLMPKERQTRIKLLDFEISSDLFINIFRISDYTDILGYYVRSKFGAVIIINEVLSPAEQADVIKLIIEGMNKCPSSELGLVNNNNQFVCGGHCCFNME